MADIPVCPEKMQLLEDFEQAAFAYTEAAVNLNASRGTLSREEYEETYRRIEEMRMTARRAQEALLRHTALHGC